MEEEKTVSKKQKAVKIVSWIINILSIVIMLFAIFIVTTSLTSKDRGYTVYFDRAYAVVKSDSMAQDVTKWDNFKKGDVIAFKVLADKDKLGLEVGQIITFKDYVIDPSGKALNTHRIYDVRDTNGDGVADEYSTKGDNVDHYDTVDGTSSGEQLWRPASDVQGVYIGKSAFFGKILTYLQSKTGFAIFIVVPCVLVVIYCVTLVVLNLMKYAKQKAVMQHEDNVDALKAELKAELLKEIEEEKKSKSKKDVKTQDEKKEEKAEADEKEEKSDDAKSEKQSKQKSEK